MGYWNAGGQEDAPRPDYHTSQVGGSRGWCSPAPAPVQKKEEEQIDPRVLKLDGAKIGPIECRVREGRVFLDIPREWVTTSPVLGWSPSLNPEQARGMLDHISRFVTPKQHGILLQCQALLYARLSQ